MTVHGEDDSRDPAARVVILFFRDGEGYQLGCAGPVARSEEHSQPWEQAVPPALVWLWRLEEEETEETRQTLNVNPTVKVGTIVC